jgi:hypothetical protein
MMEGEDTSGEGKSFRICLIDLLNTYGESRKGSSIISFLRSYCSLGDDQFFSKLSSSPSIGGGGGGGTRLLDKEA